MCDTMVALGHVTKSGNTIFAKNSDRQPNEPHLMIRIPGRTYQPGSKLKCTYIEIEQALKTYEVVLLKPSWIWGAEMGFNEFGLNIGNEAVFTKIKQGPPALLGMDMLRLALERCKTSTEALNLLIELLEKYGQGGNCGYEKPFFYHNSFLIADRTEAWVLETAGQFWAAKKVKDICAISNRLSLGSEWDMAHPELVSHAIKKGWCRSRDDFHFARCYSNKLFSFASGSARRKSASICRMEKEKGQITVRTMMEILRSHDERYERKAFRTHSLKTVCMHGGGLIGDHTTGSYVASLGGKENTYFLTGSSTPCISVFKPYTLSDNKILSGEGEEDKALAFWQLREELHRMVLENRIPNLDDYLSKAHALEAKALEEIENYTDDSQKSDNINLILAEAWQEEEKLVKDTIEQSSHIKGKIRGSPLFRNYWKKQNRKLRGQDFLTWG